jgi:alpha-beta hydrolase superfamily lysophospholipase
MSEILDKYIEELSSDTNIDAFNVKDKQMMLPSIKHKWVGRLMRHRIKVNDLKDQVETLISQGITEAKNTTPYTINDSQARVSVTKTKVIKDAYKQIRDEEMLVEFLEKIEKVFNSMTFDIKNIVEIMKLETL